MMTKLLDPYSWCARAFPMYLAIMPIACALASILPHGLKLTVSGSVALVFAPLAFVMRQIGADFGKRLEKRLWQRWGGPPTTRFLRHRNNEFNEITRQRIHEKLRKFGLHVPTKEEEETDPVRADVHYEACVEELIRITRDRKDFPLVFENLADYGFRRNLLGLKPLGLLIAVVSFLLCLYLVLVNWDVKEPSTVAIVAAVLALGILLMWTFWVNEKAVRIAAERYARSLLEAALKLE